MAGPKELIKKLSEDDALRDQIVDTPSREGKQEVVRSAGLEVPDHHDVLQEVAGGVDLGPGGAGGVDLDPGSGGIGAGMAAAVAAAAV